MSGPDVPGEPGSGIGEKPGVRISVDAREASGVLVGEGNTQINYHYGSGPTWSDGVSAPPLVSVSGGVDSPYRGLAAFEERDAGFFFGREGAATTILALMSRHLDGSGPLVVSGASGVGKSSLLRAGVLPRLRGEGLKSAPESTAWPCLAFTPTRDPLDELAVRVAALARTDAAVVRRELAHDPGQFALTARQAALASGDPEPARPASRPRLLLIIDQLEQLFTQCTEEQQRRAFTKALHAAASPEHGPDGSPVALVVLAVRADFEAHCADYPELAPAVQDRFLVTPMSERQLRMAITEPAAKAGSRVEDELIRVLLDEASSRASVRAGGSAGTGAPPRAGVLPLLSHALDQAWRQRAGDTLSVADYERTGGIEGAVAVSAQRAYAGLTEAQQSTARQIFTRLVAISPDGIDVAGRVSQPGLVEGQSPGKAHDVSAVLEQFAAERLLTLAAGTVEISHEALLTAWPLLRDEWLAENRTDRIILTRLRNTVADWAADSRDPCYLYRGSLLETANATGARISAHPARLPSLSQDEQGFLYESSAAQAREQRKARRRIRYQFAALAAALAAIATSVVVAAHQEQLTSRRDEALALSILLAARADRLRSQDTSLSSQLALAAYRIDPTPEARSSLLDSTDVPAATQLPASAGQVNVVAVDRGGGLLADGTDTGTIQLWDITADGHATRTGPILHNPSGGISAVDFSPNGRILAAAGTGHFTPYLWDTASREHLPGPVPLPGATGPISSIAISPGGRLLAAAMGNGVGLWNITHPRHPARVAYVTGPSGATTSVAFSPDGHTLAAGSWDKKIYLWSTASPIRPVPLKVISRLRSVIFSVAFSPDGRYLAAGTGAQHNVFLWDIRRPGHPEPSGPPLSGPASWVTSVAFSPDSQTVAASSADGQVWLYSTITHTMIEQLPHPSPVTDVAYRSSKSLVSVSNDGTNGTLRIWQVPGPIITGAKDAIFAVSYDRSGEKLAVGPGAQDNTLTVWDAATTQHPVQLGPPLANRPGRSAYSGSGALTPDGKTFAVGCADGWVQLWDIADPAKPSLYPPFKASSQLVESVTISNDGRLLAVSSDDGAIHLWDIANPRHPVHITNLRHKTKIQTQIYGAAFNSNSSLLAAASSNGKVYLWSITNEHHPHLLSTLTGFTEAAYATVFADNGHMLAASSADDTVRLWDLTHPAHPAHLATLTGPIANVYSIAYNPAHHELAAASTDGTIWLWSLANPRKPAYLATLIGPAKGILAVTFSPDGDTLAAGSEDKTVHLWNTNPQAAARWICATIGTPITRQQWAQLHLVPNIPYSPPCR